MFDEPAAAVEELEPAPDSCGGEGLLVEGGEGTCDGGGSVGSGGVVAEVFDEEEEGFELRKIDDCRLMISD